MKKIFVFIAVSLSSFAFAKPIQSSIEIINGEPALNHQMTSSVVGLFVKNSDPTSEFDGGYCPRIDKRKTL